MASVLFSFVVVTLVILYVQKRNIALSYRLIGSTCNETKLLPLTPPMKCVNGRSDETFFYIDCTDLQHFKRGFEWTLNMQLGLPVYNVIRNHTESHDDVWNCVFILQWSGSTVHLENDFHLNFNVRPWMFAGISKYICDTGNASNCAFQVKIRKDILALPPFSFTPDEPEFWNFSSPLFRSEFEWMSSLYLSGSLTDHYPYELPGLSGSSVQKLFVNGNFGTDQRGSLPHLDNLPLLDTLTIFNSTRDLTKEHLTATRNIKYLNLLNIKFLKLPKFIADLKKLQNLTFQSTKNNFTFSPETLLGLHFLEVLNLSGNRIVQWTMPHFRTLRVLYLNYCKMKKFSTNELLLEHSELRELYLRGNALNSLSSEAFFGVQGLWTLDLSYNLINQLPSQIFTPLTNLSRLFLQGNNLTDWPILSCINYKIIDVSQNLIQKLINLGHQINSVHEIDVSNNRISGWNNRNIFMMKISRRDESRLSEFVEKRMNISATYSSTGGLIPWASRVNLSNNLLTVFTSAMLTSLSALEEVDLGGNFINCGDCNTSHFQQWLASTRTTVKNLGTNTPLLCYTPWELKGRPIQEINFDEVCFIPRRYLWLGIGAPIAGVIAFVAIGGVIFYYRTEVVYLAHLAKVRATSKKKMQIQSLACYDAFVCYRSQRSHTVSQQFTSAGWVGSYEQSNGGPSHSGKNRKWVMRRLVPLLERRPENYSLCLFDRDFALGSHIVTNIVDAIDQSRKVIVVLTQHFIDSKWCQWELEMAQHKLFSEDREFLVLLELEPLERRRLPRLLRFLLDTRPVVRWPRPETAPAVKAAAAELRRALGPSLRQNLFVDTPTGNEPRPTTSAADVQESLLTDEHTQGN